MSDALKHNGKCLGWIHSYTGDGINKFVLEMEGIGELEKMFRLPDEARLEVDGMQPMTYRDFRNQILSRTKRIYLSTKEYDIDFHSGRNSS